MQYFLIAGHGEIKLDLRWTLTPCRLAFIMSEGNMPEDNLAKQSYSYMDLICYNMNMMDKVCSLAQFVAQELQVYQIAF